MLQLYNFIESTKTLGPYDRFALWTQGCPFSCPSCMTPDSQSLDGGETVSVVSLAEHILNTPKIEGITISGGEPFLQSKALNTLLNFIKSKRDLGVIVYTGYTLEQIKAKNSSDDISLLKNIDILIDGLYEDSLNDGLSLRGSSNQNLHQFTKRYVDVFGNYYNKSIREVEIHMQDDNAMLVGIPQRTFLNNS